MAKTPGAPAPVPATFHLSVLADRVDDLETIQDALLGLESLIEPTFGSDKKQLAVQRDHLYALVAMINTRFVLALEAAQNAVKTLREGAVTC